MSVIEMRMLRWISGNTRYDMKWRNSLKDSENVLIDSSWENE